MTTPLRNIMPARTYQFLAQVRGHPTSPISVLRCPCDVSYNELLAAISATTAPFYLAQNPNSRATTPVYGFVSNIQYRFDGHTYNLADQAGLDRACRMVARLDSMRLQGSEWVPLFLTFDVAYPQFVETP